MPVAAATKRAVAAARPKKAAVAPKVPTAAAAKKAAAAAAVTVSATPIEAVVPDVGAFRTTGLTWYAAHRRDLPWRRPIVADGTSMADLRVPGCRDDAAAEYTAVTPYAIWISEIMSQQTQIATVVGYWRRWVVRFPTAAALAAATPDAVNESWAGLGYYRRAAFLHKGAKHVVAEHGGALPPTVEGLARGPGIGPYTAGAVASICFGVDAPVVDGNVLRVVARLRGDDGCDVKAGATVKRTWADAQHLVRGCAAPGAWNQFLMELGATVCKPGGAPLCAVCPLAAACGARRRLQLGDIEAIDGVVPLKSAGKAKRVLHHATVVITDTAGERVLLVRRPSGGLLADLWDFPEVEVGKDASAAVMVKRLATALATGPAAACVRAPLLPPKPALRGTVRHIFTHIDFTTTVFAASAAAGDGVEGAVQWVALGALDGVAMSTLGRKVWAAAAGLEHPATPTKKRPRA
jgi:A/G-specific adenine glycosylase